MNIETFLMSFDDFYDIIPNKTYPKNVDYFWDYKTLKVIQNKGIQNNGNQNKYMIYQEKNSNVVKCIGIDQELEYIKKLDYVLKLPVKNRFHLKDAILEGIELFDNLIYIDNNFPIKKDSRIDINLIYKLLNEQEDIDMFEQQLLLIPFDGNPIKKDIYLTQFIYFIKKYLEFRLESKGDKMTKLSKNEFKFTLHYGLLNYIESDKKSLFYKIILEELILKQEK